jgi:hypothetical protein
MVSEYAAAIVLGVVSTLLIEWPFLRIRDRMFPDKTTPVPVTEQSQTPQVPAESGLVGHAPVKLEGIGGQSYLPVD